MPDVVDDLRRYADAVTETVRAVDFGRVTSRPARPRRRFAVVAAALAAIVVAAIVIRLDSADGPDVQLTTPTSATTNSTSTTRDATSTTLAEESSLRTFPAIAVSDDQILVWGGEAGSEAAVRGDGFAISIESGQVREIPAAPLSPRSGTTGVWTGSDLVVCCGTGQADGYVNDTQSAAAWNPAAGEWRSLAQPPANLARSYPASVWTGTEMVVIATGPAAAVYDPTSDSWTTINPPPIRGRQPQAVWTGDEVLVWDPLYEGSATPSTGAVVDRGWRWTPGDDAWTELPPLPDGNRTRLGSAAWTGTELVVWGLSTEHEDLGVGARWRPGTDAWIPTAPSPQGAVVDPFNGTPGSQTVTAGDGRVVVKGLDGGQAAAGGTPSDPLMIYYPSTDQWTTTSLAVPGFNPVILVANNRVFVPDRLQPIVGVLPSS